ncbi:MAG: hypothetical protein HY342_05515 [Candidatus Lambdaproteobacteria bacterium]|nr:hypothetical protein [Candidatus Lambdaproteobacteria bacterium]
MKSAAYHEKYHGLSRNAEFEELVSTAAERAVLEMDKMVADEVKLKYLTHIFAKTLDDIASWLIKPKYIN